MLYDNIIYDDLVNEKVEQLNIVKKEILNIKKNINSNSKLKNDLVLININNKLNDKIDVIDGMIDNVINYIKKYISEIDILNNNIITNHSEINENIYVRRINEIIENDL